MYGNLECLQRVEGEMISYDGHHNSLIESEGCLAN